LTPDAVSKKPPSFARSRLNRPLDTCCHTRLLQPTREPVNETIFGNQRNQTETELAYVFSQQAASLGALEAHMNHSFHSADRATHLKIVIVALVAGVTVAAFGIAARSNVDYSQTPRAYRSSKPVSRWW